MYILINRERGESMGFDLLTPSYSHRSIIRSCMIISSAHQHEYSTGNVLKVSPYHRPPGDVSCLQVALKT